MRIKTYIPPPLPSAVKVKPKPLSSELVDRYDGPDSATKLESSPPIRRKASSIIALPAGIYPSPGSSQPLRHAPMSIGRVRIDTSFSPSVSHDRSPRVRPYLPPSPPTSDPITMPHDSDLRIEVDLRIMRESYGQVRDVLLKVLFMLRVPVHITCSCVSTSSADVLF